MKSRTRYSLIAAGITLFILASPFIVLYVSGTKYDFKNHRFVKTGIISVRTAPRGAKILLNGKSAGTSQKNIKFLDPGDYDIRITRNGYFDWQKRLNVKAQYVTYINLDLDYLVLFKNAGTKTQIADGVLNFSADRSRAMYLQKDAAFVGNIQNLSGTGKIPLDRELASAQIISADDENLYLILGQGVDGKPYTAVLDDDRRKISNLDAIVTPTATSNFKFYNGTLFELTDKILYSINWQTAKKNILIQNVDAYGFSGDNLYLTSNGQIFRAALPNIQLESLVRNIPTFTNSELYVSNQKQVFLLGDGNFYSVGTSLNQLASGVSTVRIDSAYRKLLFSSNNEIDIYDLSNGAVTFVTRSTEAISNPEIFYREGWIFYNQNGKLQGLELDPRDHQNNYTFAESTPNAPFAISQAANDLLFLNNGVLTLQEIR